jgi:hypothetical protein
VFAVCFIGTILAIFFGMAVDKMFFSLLCLILAAVGLGTITGQDIVVQGFTDPLRIAIVLFELITVLWIVGFINPKLVMTARIYALSAMFIAVHAGIVDISDNIVRAFGIPAEPFTNWGLVGAGALVLTVTRVYQSWANELRVPDNTVDGGLAALAMYLMHRIMKGLGFKLEVKKQTNRK